MNSISWFVCWNFYVTTELKVPIKFRSCKSFPNDSLLLSVFGLIFSISLSPNEYGTLLLSSQLWLTIQYFMELPDIWKRNLESINYPTDKHDNHLITEFRYLNYLKKITANITAKYSISSLYTYYLLKITKKY